MSSALVFDAVVKDGKIALVDDQFYRTKSAHAAKGWGDGCALKVRIEPEEDAYTHGQMKHYYGHIISPLSEWNGEFPTEWDVRLKAMFLPEGKTSKTQCNREELDAYIHQCEVYAHTAHPEAFALYDNVRR